MESSYHVLRPVHTPTGRPGISGTMRWRMETEPYTSYPELIAIPDVQPETGPILGRLMRELHLEDVTECHAGEGLGGSYILRKADGGAFDRFDSPELRTLRTEGFRAGPVLRMRGGSVLAFTNRIALQFKASVGPDEQKSLFSDVGAIDVRPSNVIPRHYVLTIDPGIGEGINEMSDRLLASDLLEYAYPEIWESPAMPLDR